MLRIFLLTIILQFLRCYYQIVSSYTPIDIPSHILAGSSFRIELVLWSEQGELLSCNNVTDNRNSDSLGDIFTSSFYADSFHLGSTTVASGYECGPTTALFGMSFLCFIIHLFICFKPFSTIK